MAITNLAETIKIFWDLRGNGIYFPSEWEDILTIKESCQIQLGLLDRLVDEGNIQAGWKVGLTSKAIQDQFRVDEPLFGYVLEKNRFQAKTQFQFDDLILPGFENEICMTLGSDLIGPKIEMEEALAAVTSIRPAIELIETRGPFTEQLALAITDNIQQRGVILGPETRFIASDFDLRAVHVDVSISGSQVAEGTGDAVLGHPINSLIWIANKLAEYGKHLRAGEIVMTGSLTRQFSISKGDSIKAQFTPIGEVSASFI